MIESSAAVGDGLRAFYEAFNTGDVARFGERIADGEGVSVIGSAPGEGHASRADWLGAYESGIAAAGLKLEGGGAIEAFAEGDAGFALDTPAFVLPDGARLETRLTAVLARQGGEWRVVHAHFSVGVADEDAVRAPDEAG